MIKSLRQLFDRFKSPQTGKRYYLKQLEQFSDIESRIEVMGEMTIELWRRMDPVVLSNQNPRTMMAVNFFCRHPNITMLIESYRHMTWAIAAGDEDAIKRVTESEFSKPIPMNLDTYFSDAQGYMVGVEEKIRELREVIVAHGELLDQLESRKYRRLLSRMYYDTYMLTQALVETIEE